MSAQGPHILPLAPHAFGTEGILGALTNTVISTWLFMLVIFVVSGLLFSASRQSSGLLRTTGYLIVKHLRAFIQPLVGHHLPVARILWLVGGVFLYILGANLYGILIDIVGTFWPTIHNYLRPINADINTTLGLGLVMVIISHGMMIHARGFFGYIGHFLFHFAGNNLIEKVINMAVGWLHIIGEGVRVLGLSCRLFGNIFAGVVLLGVIGWLGRSLSLGGIPFGEVLSIPFYFLEILVSCIQAVIFSTLITVYFAEASEHDAH